MQETSNPNRTLDLASALEIGGSGNKLSGDHTTANGTKRSLMTIAFEFAFETHMQENVASMASQYVRTIISSVQRVALALAPSHLNPNGGLTAPMGIAEPHTLAKLICQSYRCYLGVELLKNGGHGNEPILTSIWHHSDAIMCYSLKV